MFTWYFLGGSAISYAPRWFGWLLGNEQKKWDFDGNSGGMKIGIQGEGGGDLRLWCFRATGRQKGWLQHERNGNMKATQQCPKFQSHSLQTRSVFFFLGGLRSVLRTVKMLHTVQLHVDKEHPPCRSIFPEINLKTGISRCVCVARFVVKS